MAVYVEGAVGIVVFYVAVLAVGMWAARKQKGSGEEEVMLAGRNIGVTVGALTLVATWVGGAYLNGTAEVLFSTGLVWCQVPIGYSLSLFFGVLLFVRPMREANYITMLDPFQRQYGARVGGLLYVPALCGDLFWVGAILNALGSSLVVILEIDRPTSVIVSAVFAAAYTMVGGLYSVSYTDVLQLFCIVFGLVLSAPFAYHHPAVDKDLVREVTWLGKLETRDVAEWLDSMLLLIFGGIPWQSYFQRILSMKSVRQAQLVSFLATVGCVAMALPPALFGVVAKAVDWSSLEGFQGNGTTVDAENILPLTLRYLTPGNIYKMTLRPNASEREVLWALRISVVAIAGVATAIALTVGSIYYLSYLCSDLVYVILFPQLLLVVHWARGVNTYGCLASFGVGLLLRVLGGEPGLGVPAVIRYPGFDDANAVQKFPFRTFTMVCALVTHVGVSAGTRAAFTRGALPASWDVLREFGEKPAMDKVTLQSALAANHADAKEGVDNPMAMHIVETNNKDRRESGL